MNNTDGSQDILNNNISSSLGFISPPPAASDGAPRGRSFSKNVLNTFYGDSSSNGNNSTTLPMNSSSTAERQYTDGTKIEVTINNGHTHNHNKQRYHGINGTEAGASSNAMPLGKSISNRNNTDNGFDQQQQQYVQQPMLRFVFSESNDPDAVAKVVLSLRTLGTLFFILPASTVDAFSSTTANSVNPPTPQLYKSVSRGGSSVGSNSSLFEQHHHQQQVQKDIGIDEGGNSQYSRKTEMSNTTTLLPLVHDVVSSYLDHGNVEVRKEAASCCCRLLLSKFHSSGEDSSTNHNYHSPNDHLYGGPSDAVTEQVLTKLM